MDYVNSQHANFVSGLACDAYEQDNPFLSTVKLETFLFFFFNFFYKKDVSVPHLLNRKFSLPVER